jgi:hypothetical protein
MIAVEADELTSAEPSDEPRDSDKGQVRRLPNPVRIGNVTVIIPG